MFNIFVLKYNSQGADFNAVWCWAKLSHCKIQPHSHSTAHPERSEQMGWEWSVKRVYWNQTVIHAVKPQSSCDSVQKHPHAGGIDDGHLYFLIGMHGCTAHVWQLQTPRLVVIAQARTCVRPFTGHAAAGHAQRGATPPPLHLPVAALRGERLETEHLSPSVEALREVGVAQRRLLEGGHSVSFGEN